MVGSKKPLYKKEINIHEVLERVRSLVTAEIADQTLANQDWAAMAQITLKHDS